MRQIFIMYPAVHDAYEEKVPLELSEEQFWRKYLESEYFHRDRGRIGCSAKQVVGAGVALMLMVGGGGGDDKKKGKDEEEVEGNEAGTGNGNGGGGGNGASGAGGSLTKEREEENQQQKEREETARMGAASSNDIFSRREIELKKRLQQQQTDGNMSVSASASASRMSISTSAAGQGQRQQRIAVGQFDLTATANTERGAKLLLNSNDLHPFDDRGKKVIEKYNRHWAMVLNPDDATAGCDLTELAKRSALHVLEDDDDAKVNGGFGREMKRLVGFANADHDHVDHVKGMGRSISNKNTNANSRGGKDGDDDDYDYESEPVLFEELKLRNVDAYAGGKNLGTNAQTEDSLEMDKKDIMFSQFALDQVKMMVQPLIDSKGAEGSQNSIYQVGNTFPHPSFGAKLLMSLTDRMVKDAMTEKDTVKMTKSLPEDFRKRLTSYTRRSDELLRHFFALRHVMEQEKKANGNGGGSSSSSNGQGNVNQSSHKLKRIVQGMEDVFRELEEMRKSFPQAELGERMRKMCKPIMDQLDSAFVLNKDSSRSGGGFVDIQ